METILGTSMPTCVATTGDAFCKTVREYQESTGRKSTTFLIGKDDSNYFSNAQFSDDGTTIITHNADNNLRTFILPPDLLEESDEPHTLRPHATLNLPTPCQSYAIYPHFDLQDASTTVYLASAKDLPISLNNALHEGITHAQYSLVNPLTEEYTAASSLLWSRDGTHFVAGSKNQIAVFDISRQGEDPVVRRRTAQGRRARVGVSSECKGPITALNTNIDGVLAAGSTERNIALYANEGSGECITSFSLCDQRDYLYIANGTGVSQLAWTPDGTYLLVAERQSDGIQVFDMRNTHQRVSWLSGRRANTPQRLGIDILPTADGCEVWAGGTDGCARTWKNPGASEGEQQPDAVLELHDEPITSAIWHPSGAVLATCAGTRQGRSYCSDSSEESNNDETRILDNTLKIWTL